jgi:hypothetical protein
MTGLVCSVITAEVPRWLILAWTLVADHVTTKVYDVVVAELATDRAAGDAS